MSRDVPVGSRVGIIIGALLLLIALPSVGSARDGSRTAARKTMIVKAAGDPIGFLWAWDPDEITISKGDRVRWENPTDAAHHVVSWDGPWKMNEHLDVGGSFTRTFKKPGVYKYWCDVFGHADIVYLGTERICVGMCGVVTVT